MGTETGIERKMVIWVAVGALLAAALVAVLGRSNDASGSASISTATTVVGSSNRAGAAGAGSVVPVTATAGHNHAHLNADQQSELQPDQPLDNAIRDQLAGQLVAARNVALRYPTAADAQKAGLILAGGFAPFVGAHYVQIASAAGGQFDAAKPPTLIYDGTSPTSRIVGLMYLSAGGAPTAPEGFAGPNDHWHRHTGVCITFTAGMIGVPFPADADVTKAQCDGVKGQFLNRTQWMVHAWVVPGWESPAGVFSHDNVDLQCADGTGKIDKAGFCPGT